MDTSTIRNIINVREATDNEWQEAIDKCWLALTDALTEDIKVTRKFLLEDCTANEASWISEVYDDVIERTQSHEYVELFRKSIERFPEETKKYHLAENLDLAVSSMLRD